MKKKHVTLVLTRKCNLACKYCYEHHKDAQSMPLDLATSILEFELNARNEYDTIEVDLFGGEPFMAFETMKHIVEFLQLGSFEKRWTLSTITNGTLISGEVKEWLRINAKDVECVLSYDGTPHMQDINRGKGTSKIIDCKFFQEVFPQTPVKMTVSQETLSNLAEGTIYLHKLGLLVNNSLANGVAWDEESLVNELTHQLGLLVDYYVENPAVQECSMLQFPYEDIYTSTKKGVVYRLCDAHTGMTCFDVDGQEYPCQQFLPMSTGATSKEDIDAIAFPSRTVSKHLLDTECRSCPISSACQSCYGQNWLDRKSIYKQDRGMCAMQKVQFKAKAYLAALKWERGHLDLTPEEEKMLLESIQLLDSL